MGGPGRPRALVTVSRVAPDIVTVRLVRQDRRPCRRSKISAGLPSRTRRRAAFSELDHQLIGHPKSQRGARCPPADRSRGTRALYHFGSACGLAKSEAEEFAEQNEGRRVLTATHRRRILRRDCSRQLLVAPPKAPQRQRRRRRTSWPMTARRSCSRSLLTRSTEDFVARLTPGGRVWAARLVAELLLRLTEDRRAAVKRPD